MKKLVMTALVIGLAACGKPSEQPAGRVKAGAPKVGEHAPQLVLNKILRGDLPRVGGWGELAGKAVVLEFWGTYCEPCRENIPHMNELVEKFRNRPVVFISLSKESASSVEEFMGEYEMKGNVAAEAAGAYRNFSVRGIPHTVLVDKDGIIRAFSYPSFVTPDSIEALLAGRPIPGAFAEKE